MKKNIRNIEFPPALQKYMAQEETVYFDEHEASGSQSREYGKPRQLTQSNQMQCYLRAFPGMPDPSHISVTSKGQIAYAPVCQYLADCGWRVVWQYSNYRTKEMERPGNVIMVNPEMIGYMIEFQLDWSTTSIKRKKKHKRIENYAIPGTVAPHPDYYMTEGDTVKIDESIIFTPNRDSEYWNQPFVEDFLKLLELHEMPPKNENAEVGIIVISQGDYDVKSFSLEEAMTSFEHPDLHYGEGFENFHKSMMTRIEDESKGLILFHGEPGTGKTQYIRHLLKELCSANKAVLYSPPAVSASLAEPQMINFISDWIMGERRDCILLIEDAEPLLESRSGGVDGRSTGISNLLNITDGILNDILGLMVIATFNIDIHKIDPALLRPGRLIARKEFKKMEKAQAESLSAKLNITPPENVKYPITIAEFYNNSKEKQILVHDYSTNQEKRIGFKP